MTLNQADPSTQELYDYNIMGGLGILLNLFDDSEYYNSVAEEVLGQEGRDALESYLHHGITSKKTFDILSEILKQGKIISFIKKLNITTLKKEGYNTLSRPFMTILGQELESSIHVSLKDLNIYSVAFSENPLGEYDILSKSNEHQVIIDQKSEEIFLKIGESLFSEHPFQDELSGVKSDFLVFTGGEKVFSYCISKDKLTSIDGEIIDTHTSGANNFLQVASPNKSFHSQSTVYCLQNSESYTSNVEGCDGQILEVVQIGDQLCVFVDKIDSSLHQIGEDFIVSQMSEIQLRNFYTGQLLAYFPGECEGITTNEVSVSLDLKRYNPENGQYSNVTCIYYLNRNLVDDGAQFFSVGAGAEKKKYNSKKDTVFIIGVYSGHEYDTRTYTIISAARKEAVGEVSSIDLIEDSDGGTKVHYTNINGDKKVFLSADYYYIQGGSSVSTIH